MREKEEDNYRKLQIVSRTNKMSEVLYIALVKNNMTLITNLMQLERKKKQRVIRHNELLNAKMNISLAHMRIFLYCSSLIRPEDDELTTYRIPLKEFSQDCGVKGTNWYSKFRNELKDFKDAYIEVFSSEKEGSFTFINIFLSVGYVKSEGVVEICFNPKLKPYLLSIKGNFTQYDVKQALAMSSVNSIRIFELLKQYESFGKRRIGLEELKDILNLKEKYSTWSGFKNRVLEQAKKECQDHTDLNFAYKTIKSGRKITALQFLIQKKSNQEIETALPETEFIQSLKANHINNQKISSLLQNYSNDYLQFVWQKAKTQNPKNLAAFFLKALQEDYYKTQYNALQETKKLNKVKSLEQEKKRKEETLKHEFRMQYVEARDETAFKPTTSDRKAFEKSMKERIAQAPAFQIMFDTYLQTGTSTEFRDFLLKKYGKPHQYDFTEFMKNKFNK